MSLPPHLPNSHRLPLKPQLGCLHLLEAFLEVGPMVLTAGPVIFPLNPTDLGRKSWKIHWYPWKRDKEEDLVTAHSVHVRRGLLSVYSNIQSLEKYMQERSWAKPVLPKMWLRPLLPGHRGAHKYADSCPQPPPTESDSLGTGPENLMFLNEVLCWFGDA